MADPARSNIFSRRRLIQRRRGGSRRRPAILNLGSCTANAGVGLVEYFERRASGKHLDASRLFPYKVTRDLPHWTGDTGALLRTVMKALTLFGVPPEGYYPYSVPGYDKEPPAFCYAFAQSYQAISCYRFDPPGTPRDALLNQIKSYLMD
jgi:C1A family cysteine protease